MNEIPEGYALVLIEPTLEMKRAGQLHGIEYLNHAADIWTEMMAHSPLVPAPLPPRVSRDQLQTLIDIQMKMLDSMQVHNARLISRSEPVKLTDGDIEDLALANGFKFKIQPDNSVGLHPYVFEFARAVIAASRGGV